MRYSEVISEFLNLIREVQQEYNIAIAEEQDANNATQDILHNIELCENKYGSNAGGLKTRSRSYSPLWIS